MKRYLFLLSLLPVLTSPSFCQSATGAAPAAGKLRFAVVVSDAHGAPIRDLRREDFEIEVAGKPQSGDVLAPAPPPDASHRSASDGRGLVVVVIDTIHTRWREEKDLRLDAGKYLAGCAKRNVPVSLAILNHNGVLVPVHEYTAGSATLAAALEQADAEMHHRTPVAGASPEVVAEARRFVDFYRGSGAFSSAESMRAYPGAVLDGFNTVAQYTSAIPGRKSLIWISTLIPFEVEEKKGRVASPTNENDLLYPYVLTPDQVNDLQVIWKQSIGSVQRSELALFPVAIRATAAVRLDPQVVHSMSSMAHMTGGFETHSVGNVFGFFQELPETNTAAYDVVLSPEAARECKSDWCELKITVKRADAHVAAPQGFFRDASVVPDAPVVAAHAPLEPDPGPNAIPFTVNWKPAEDAGSKKKVAFVVSFGPTAGIPSEGSTELNLEITVHAIANGADKQAVSFGAKTQLPQATLDQIRTKGFVLNNAIELDPGDYDVRFVVHDKVTGRSGIISVPLKVA